MTLRRHLGSYAAIGLLQWLVEYGFMLALSEWVMPVEPANVIGRLAGAMLGFWLNGKWTFAGEGTHVGRRAVLRFVLMWLVLTLLNTWLVGVIDEDYGLRRAQLLKPLVDMLSGGIGFLLSRHWVYKKGGGGNQGRP
ncbi:GtrA family protein [Thermomonas sp.]|uniref:GtrA family protein n=1 Tax=Thermomonas sp. TaxID=1971895 RepID=UPI002486DA02|nr:GtrA family protein [Thermomonas sp.]MDI1252635.1 GtrA family protein [Thermomonas sp.]